jgi:hypothetical protein
MPALLASHDFRPEHVAWLESPARGQFVDAPVVAGRSTSGAVR